MEWFSNSFSQETWYQKYKAPTDNNVEDTWRRVAKDLASIEDDKEKWEEEFYGILEGFKFVPGGRITSNAGLGLTGTSYLNCYVSGPTGKDIDSIEGIYGELLQQAQILKSEGGYGFNADFMRPRGSHISGIANQSPGAVKFLELWDKSSEIITEGSGKKGRADQKNFIRKGAQMVTMSCWHPDIIEFIEAKKTEGRLTKFNMSVLCTDEFMHAIAMDAPWNLVYPNYEKYPELYKEHWDGNINKWLEHLGSQDDPVVIYHTFESARDLWELMMDNTYNRNEPGCLFVDTINRMNNLYYEEYISASNPCLAGDTKVYVADGRGDVTIKELADDGKDVPVMCLNDKGVINVRTMRHPRVTGYNQPIFKVTLDDGSIVRCTSNHKFLTTSKEYKELKDLNIGDSLQVITKFEGSLKDVFPNANSRSQDYIWLNYGKKVNKSEHRLIHDFHNNAKTPPKHVIHHKDFDGKNNHPDNLQMMTTEDHDAYHAQFMLGDNNPMRRAKHEWSEEKWADYRANMSEATSAEKNGRYSGVTNDELEEHALILTKKLGYRFSSQDWQKYALERNLPSQFSKWRNDHFNGVGGFAKSAALRLGLENVDADPRSQRMYTELTKNGYDCVFENDKLLINKKCEICNKNIKVEAQFRERSMCSKECHSKFISRINSNRSPEELEYNRQQQLKSRKPTKDKKRHDQLQIYSDLKFNLGRAPFRKEWEEACKSQNISFRLGKNSPFKGFRQLKKEHTLFNHKIVSIEPDGYEDVYNGTVDEYHNFLIGGFNSKNDNNKDQWQYICNLQCGEQVISKNSVCLLGSVNLVNFIDTDTKDWKYNELKKVIKVAIRLMDNVNDVSDAPLPAQKESLVNKRRIGLGVFGYGSALMMARIKYGSKKCLEMTESLMDFIRDEAYRASIEIAKEKGVFELYDEEKYLESNFVKTLSPSVQKLIKKHGIRNSHLLSLQPTGNSACFANLVSSGLEPLFSHGYVRTSIQPATPEGLWPPSHIDWSKKTFDTFPPENWDETGFPTEWKWIKEGDEDMLATEFEGKVWKYDRTRGLLKEECLEDYAVTYLKKEGKWNEEAKWAATAMGLDIDDHVSVMTIFANRVCSSISKTINVPNDYPYEDFKDVYFKAWEAGIKGITSYRVGTMASVLSTTSSLDSNSPDKIVKTAAPERPKELDCDVYHITVKGEQYFVLVGLYEGDPYEVFAGKNGFIDKSVKKGKIIRLNRPKGFYKAILEDGSELSPINSNCTEAEDALTRITSTALRHGADIHMIVQQLEKTRGDMTTFSKSMARALKKYIVDGTEEGESCPECSAINSIVRMDGCKKCQQCGNSTCS